MSREKKDKPHISVMLEEVVKFLKLADGENYLDCTFGAGGYSTLFLEKANCTLTAIDRDPSVKVFADNLKEKFGNRFKFINDKFSNIKNHIKNEKFDGIVLDLGVSSMQLDTLERGFSFNKEAKLDMQMGSCKMSAYDVVNTFSENDLADIIYNYGDEVKSRHIARKIVEERTIKPIETTVELANIVRSFYIGKKLKIDPATKTFQAIRIYINDELNELRKILEDSKDLLNIGGRLIVVTFHSLEDSIVKDFMKKVTGNINKEKKNKYKEEKEFYEFELLTKKPIIPTETEVKDNIRSRSAKLRAIKKCL